MSRKNRKKKFWYLGYIFAAVIGIIIFVTDFSQFTDILLGGVLAAVFSVSHVMAAHEKLLAKDSGYAVDAADERNLMMREKAGNISNMINMILMACATVAFIALDYRIPAVITGVIVFVQPFIVIAISNQLEKRM